MLWSEVAELNRNALRARAHHRDRFAHLQTTLLDADVVHHAFVGVVVRVKDERLERRIKWTARCGDALHQRLKNLRDPLPLFRRGEDYLFARDRERLLQLVHHRLWIRGGEVDLVQHWNDDEPHLHGEMHVCEGLRLNPLARIHHEDCAVTGLQAA